MKYKNGFSLIETVIIVSVLAVIMVAITSVLLNSFKARNRVDLTDVVEQNGSYILRLITDYYLNSDGKNVVCGGNSLTIISKKDAGQTVFQCNELTSIASNSAVLTQGVVVSNCSQFVSCDTSLSTGEVTAINIGFTLTATDAGAGVENSRSRSFRAKVAARQ